ncbi:Group 4 capsule polysaccharide lipoprotein gfcB, YjbF [Albimonas donghaensis]|uniref:Group 4 capsule polysaccharide lipoprotein gfcB, YjbF n=1 Tax=Albimonas donghaensis TaxID=356660 RepID=A0A1H2ZDJ7_9RHOB|nr:YjbF family lipoprotein [Albimonas donghaensis]SDX15397.1 Group 4 capsule polysaccharide lipoprotein gfcB, YjbF [Albimonas donghaensis]
MTVPATHVPPLTVLAATAPMARLARAGGPSRIIRAALAGVGLAVLAGCSGGTGSSGGDSGAAVLASVGDVIADQTSGLFGSDDEAPPPTLTRAQINAINAALVTGSIDESPDAFFVALAINGPRVTYMTPTRQSLTFDGMALAATHGLGVDLAGYKSDREADPLVTRRPLRDWPARVTRIYRYHDALGGLFTRTFECALRWIGTEPVEIYELTYDLVHVEELCASPYRKMINRYWVDEETGFVWKSRQYVSPERGSVDLKVLTPFAP